MTNQPVQELLIYRWVTGFFSTPGDLTRELSQGGVVCDGGCQYLAVLTRIDHYRYQRQRLGMEKMYQLKTALLALCGRLFPQGYSCMGSDTYAVTILTRRGMIHPDAWEEAVLALRQALQAEFGVTLTVGVGTRAASAAAVPESVRNAYIAARYRMVFGPAQTIRYEDISMRVGVSPAYPDDEIKQLLRSFERGDPAEFERRLTNLFSIIYSQSVQFGLAAAGHLLMELYRCLPPDAQAGCDVVGIYTQLNECDDFSQQLSMLRSFGLAAIDNQQKGAVPSAKRKEQLDGILAYIHENYRHPDLSMTSIAEHAALSANTVRLLFREHGLASPKDYIQQLRMEEACRMLRETDLPAREIGEQVGFIDSRYFYVSFKKYSGKTAYEYRAVSTRG
ncbi:MAG: helix-turn-helix transcriptional regulator [Clostridia bacterium]|nr:helix-turn-helix transcriptional regulator [Clostridia bacterium]